MTKPKFSIVLIAKNEAKTLPRLLESLTEFRERGGEIIVVDTGSTDGTQDIAHTAGCKVKEVKDTFVEVVTEQQAQEINEKWIMYPEPNVIKAGDRLFNFAAARNYASDQAINDFILCPDCDEVWTKLDIDMVDFEISQGARRFEYEFVYSHYPDGKPQAQFRHSKAFDRMSYHWEGVVHEFPTGKGHTVYMSPAFMLLEHFQNLETPRGQYMTGLAYELFQRPDNDRNSHYFARELMYTGKHYYSAIREFGRHISMNGWAAERAQSMTFIGDCCLKLGHEADALEWYHKAIIADGTRREPWIKLAEYYYHRGDHRKTLAYAQAALALPLVSYYANDMSHYRDVPHHMVYWAAHYLGDLETAARHWRKCIEFEPNNPIYLHDAQFYNPQPAEKDGVDIFTKLTVSKLQSGIMP